MVICLKVKTLDSQTYDFTVDDEISVRQFKETIAEKTSISADLQRIIYLGRVLVDEKQLKEYDVNGKVVHVVERPPPSTRTATNTTETTPRRQRETIDGPIRGSPIFRALDGMVLGAMTIPVPNTGASPPTAQPLNASSTFCMNRITVARHMLDCANNIASYLENPERGLNNSPMDILTQGRWTMESTVVEVGISASANVDLPQNQTQNIVEALHGAVSAALRQNGHPNVTVVQLPTVFGANGSTVVATQQQPAGATPAADERAIDVEITAPAQSSAAAPETSSSREGSPSNQNQERNSTGNAANEQSNSGSPTSRRQRTGTRILADVVQQMRTVQTRLEPFVEQYHEILLNDPTFEENDTTGRESSQRIFDRVSEALHYMSHAQHAISDLMLDMSQSTPRHLCCRPILVEQSGFVSSNNYLASFLNTNGNGNEPSAPPPPVPVSSSAAAATASGTATNTGTSTEAANVSTSAPMTAANIIRTATPASRQTLMNELLNYMPLTPSTTNPAQSQGTPTATTTATGGPGQSLNQQQPNRDRDTRGLHRILSPLFLPMTNRPTPSSTANNNSENLNQANPQLQVARLIQAVVNSAPVDADVHVQINAPNLLTFNMPVPNAAGQQQQQQQSQQQQSAQNQSSNQANTNNSSSNSNSSSDSNNSESSQQPRVTTATHPTTSTQTRSTARPQVHVANLPSSHMWNARVIPANMLSSFDRFLPCSSHHIRESDVGSENNQPIPNTYLRARNQIRRRQPPPPPQENSAASTPRSTTTTQPLSSTRSSSSEDIFNLSLEDYNTPINLFGSNLTLRDLVDIAPSPNTLNRIRSELHTFIVNTLFSGSPITEENMNEAINQVIQQLNAALIFLPQFDLPDYDSRASVENFIRNTLPFIINLIREDDTTEFGTRLLRELISFVRRLFVILVTCVGRSNAELFLNQVAQMTISSNNVVEQEAIRALQRHLMAAVIRELDIARQNTSEVQEFLVIRRPEPENSTREVTPMETDDTVPELATEVSVTTQNTIPLQQRLEEPQLPIPSPVAGSTEPLPNVVVGAEPWHSNFPSNWLPIITRDIGRQRRQSPQHPFSDAYISGMTSKRRKLVTSSKPPTDVPSLISDGVRRALHTSGLATTANNNNSSSAAASVSVDDVTAAISSDPLAQTSYREALRSNIQERLRTEPDFKQDKFPNSSKYFNK